MKDDSPSLLRMKDADALKIFHLKAFRFLQNEKMTCRMKDADALRSFIFRLSASFKMKNDSPSLLQDEKR